MTTEKLKDLLDQQLITDGQFEKLEPFVSNKKISLFHDLRVLLYLGVLLFTSGLGIVIYENIGDIGHIVSIAALIIMTAFCFWYGATRALPYANGKVDHPNAYYDYVLLLGCLLFVSVQGYIQFQFSAFDDHLEWNTLITAAIFFYVAYRFDHLAVLSLAITALASFFSLTVSPQKWYSANFESANLHVVAIAFGIAVSLIAWFLNRKLIKQHFTFTYLNFALLIFFSGAVAGLFIDEGVYLIHLLLIYAGCAFAYYYARQNRSFLFLLYAFLAGYIGTTYLLADLIFDDLPELWFYYSLLSCGGFVYFIIRYKTFFKRTV